MKFTKTIALALAAGVVASSAFAEEEDSSVINGYFGGAIKSGYISNGRLFVDDPVIQPYAGILWNGFNFDIWASQDLKNDKEHGFEEIDYTLSYGGSVGDFDYTFGGVIWAYDNLENDYRAFAELTYTGIKDIVKPGIYVRYNIANADHGPTDPDHGLYGQFRLATGCALDQDEKVNFGVKAAIGYADSDYRKGSWGCDDAGFVDVEVDVSLSYAVTKQLSVTIGCLYDSVIDSDLRDAESSVDEEGNKVHGKQDDGKSDHFIGYVGCNVDF